MYRRLQDSGYLIHSTTSRPMPVENRIGQWCRRLLNRLHRETSSRSYIRARVGAWF
ncbi:MAG: hypothetical protein JNL67_16895 [Planctomycetaceae bacterium]|nr:hypothetical protein [Planctomycetaceae bacterium]